MTYEKANTSRRSFPLLMACRSSQCAFEGRLRSYSQYQTVWLETPHKAASSR